MLRFGVVAAVWGVLMAVASFTAAADPQSCLGSFGYTGAKVSCVIPPGVTAVHVVAVGGQGGTVPSADAAGSGGGLGAIVRSNLPVTPGEILDVYVGGNGGSLATGVNAGGFNGGGAGGEDGDFNQAIVAFTSGSGGGGASDVRPQNGSLDQRLIVAAGGGGYGGGVDYHNYAAGGAGGNAGQPGGTAVGFGASTCSGVCDGEGGGPGVPSQGGAGGYGCPRLTETNSAPDGLAGALGAGGAGSNPALINSGAGGGGGGGGGWYGGGGGGARGCELGGGGGGGSSFPANAVVGFDPTGTPRVTLSAAVPTVVAPPGIVGTAVVGQTLFLQRGAWSPSPTGYQESWLRCNAAGAECQPISGQPGLSYPLTLADVNSTIRVQEVTSNEFGSGVAATSAATAPVVPAASSGATAPVVSAPTSGATAPGVPAPVVVRAFALVGTSHRAIAGPVAVFAEPGVRGAPARDYSVTIKWGDSSTSRGTVVAGQSGEYLVKGSHLYARAGHYTLSVIVTAAAGASAASTNRVSVSPASACPKGSAAKGNNCLEDVSLPSGCVFPGDQLEVSIPKGVNIADVRYVIDHQPRALAGTGRRFAVAVSTADLSSGIHHLTARITFRSGRPLKISQTRTFAVCATDLSTP